MSLAWRSLVGRSFLSEPSRSGVALGSEIEGLLPLSFGRDTSGLGPRRPVEGMVMCGCVAKPRQYDKKINT